ncbi:MAG: geranylgeranyl reductase family protein [Candidatus Thorarchaeota archaeon]
MDADVVVIGAGPVGGLAARQLARKGLSVLLLEEHREVGQPVHCAGLIGINGLHENGVYPRSDVILQRVRRSIFHAPSGTQLAIDKGEPHAYVLHRDRLDQQIVREAEAAGTILQLETRVLRTQRDQNGIRLTVLKRGSKQEIQTRFIVNAEGIRAQLMCQHGLPRPKSAYMLPALQYEVANVSLLQDTVHLFFDAKIAKSFFSWVIPLDEQHARIGLATAHRQARPALDHFLKHCSLLSGAKIVKRFGGVVYTGGPSAKTVTQRWVNVGDAAGQTKATTGGGVVAGGACAILAAESIYRALKDGDYKHRELLRYERRWKQQWGRQLQLMAILRRFVNTLENHELDQLFIKLHSSQARQLIESRGDIDRQGRIIMAALTSPVLLRHVLWLILKKSRFLPQLWWGEKKAFQQG